jgi:amino acid permease
MGQVQKRMKIVDSLQYLAVALYFIVILLLICWMITESNVYLSSLIILLFVGFFIRIKAYATELRLREEIKDNNEDIEDIESNLS